MKTITVLLMIAVAGSMVEAAYLLSELFASAQPSSYSDYEFDTLRRILIYWFTGALSTVGSFFLWRRAQILSVAIGAGGIYLMLLGANGGLWSQHMVGFRFALAVLNVALFLIVLKRVGAEGGRQGKAPGS